MKKQYYHYIYIKVFPSVNLEATDAARSQKIAKGMNTKSSDKPYSSQSLCNFKPRATPTFSESLDTLHVQFSQLKGLIQIMRVLHF